MEDISRARFLDPKADLTFKKVFGEHPDLVRSFLNAMLPLDGDEEIKSIEYLPVEMVPENPLKKNTIVDVRCKDHRGRVFIVEMQMIWSREFMQRVLFNASKAYVRQLDKNEDYNLLQPVYSLNLVNEVFEPELKDYYHYYSMVNIEHTDKVIEGLHLVFVELPKFTPHTFSEKRMHVLWMRFLTEIDEKTVSVPDELLSNPETKRAVEMVRQSAFTPAQIEGYDKFWDMIRTERTYYASAHRKGLAEGRAEGRAQGLAEGRAEGKAEGRAEGKAEGVAEGKRQEKIETAKRLLALGVDVATVAKATGLTESEINGM